MDHYLFTFSKLQSEEREMLIARLALLDFEGFEEEGDSLKAFIACAKFDENLFKQEIEQIGVIFTKSIVKEQNWNEQWESGFLPVIVNQPVTGLPFASVRADFHAPVENVQFDLVVTPKMSFGTGHHATTYLMIQQMSQIDFTNRTVIDYGTGTGVLAILAEKLGAAGVIAIDNDEWSINNAQDNIIANDCPAIQIIKAETLAAGMSADIILANINLNIIIANLHAIRKACTPETIVLFSGIMVHDKENIKTALEQGGFKIIHWFSRDNWLAIQAITT